MAGLHDSARTRLYLVAVLCGALFLRVWQLNDLGFNSDEAVYAGQAAAIVQDPALTEFFPVFRAHPLLFQFILALLFQFGVSDLVGRLAAVAFGLACVYLVFELGTLLYGRKAGLIAALLVALMPYHVVVSRQVLLDGPMTFFATLSLYCLARFALSADAHWLVATGMAMGLTFLGKETSVVWLGSIYAFLALESKVRVRIRDLVLSLGLMSFVIAPFPFSLAIAGGSRTGQNYLLWQLFRQPNHEWWFYLAVVPLAIGPLVLAAALIGWWRLRRRRSWRETMLLAWIIVPFAFFQLWPTKGYQYLLPVAPAVAVLAGRALGAVSLSKDLIVRGWRFKAHWAQPLAVGVVALSVAGASWWQVQVFVSDRFTAGTGGVPRGREVGAWIQENVPPGAKFMTVGPSMANLVMFYGHRQAVGLSVSPNPLRRNPSYVPVDNPDLQFRTSELQYVVWDSFSAARTSHFSEKLLAYARKYNGRIVHSESVKVVTPGGAAVMKPVIVIYAVHP